MSNEQVHEIDNNESKARARNGLTDEQIAANIGISRSTLNEWKNRFSDISDTLKRGKDESYVSSIGYYKQADSGR